MRERAPSPYPIQTSLSAVTCGKPATRDAAFRSIEPLLRDESAAVRCAAAEFTCACAVPSLETRRPDGRWQDSAVADYMLHESHGGADSRDLVQAPFVDGICVLNKLIPADAGRVRGEARRSVPAVQTSGRKAAVCKSLISVS